MQLRLRSQRSADGGRVEGLGTKDRRHRRDVSDVPCFRARQADKESGFTLV
jgi:hypothetical protein